MFWMAAYIRHQHSMQHCTLDWCAHCDTPDCLATRHLGENRWMHKARMLVQSRCTYHIKNAFTRLQSDLDPMRKPVPALGSTGSRSAQQQTPPMPSTHISNSEWRAVDPHAIGRILSHVVRKVRPVAGLIHPSQCTTGKPALLQIMLLTCLVVCERTARARAST